MHMHRYVVIGLGVLGGSLLLGNLVPFFTPPHRMETGTMQLAGFLREISFLGYAGGFGLLFIGLWCDRDQHSAPPKTLPPSAEHVPASELSDAQRFALRLAAEPTRKYMSKDDQIKSFHKHHQ